MKQFVSSSDMANLSPVAKLKLNKWLKEKNYGTVISDGEFIPFTQLSIGQMIEFLDDMWEHLTISRWHSNGAKVLWGLSDTSHEGRFSRTDLCDTLFSAVKEVLEQKN